MHDPLGVGRVQSVGYLDRQRGTPAKVVTVFELPIDLGEPGLGKA